MTDQVWWYTARAGGIVAWVLMGIGVVWGLALSTKVTRGRPRPNWILDLHRFLGALALVFTGVHVAAIVADSYVHFGLTEVLVPFTGSWHPVAVAWGSSSPPSTPCRRGLTPATSCGEGRSSRSWRP
jgi:hypothetical protein